MTDELDTLRPEVREAVAAIDKGNGVFVNGDDSEGGIAWATVRADLLRLVDECTTLKAQSIYPRAQLLANFAAANERAEKAEAELAALKSVAHQSGSKINHNIQIFNGCCSLHLDAASWSFCAE